jgi:hypothetical protein
VKILAGPILNLSSPIPVTTCVVDAGDAERGKVPVGDLHRLYHLLGRAARLLEGFHMGALLEYAGGLPIFVPGDLTTLGVWRVPRDAEYLQRL